MSAEYTIEMAQTDLYRFLFHLAFANIRLYLSLQIDNIVYVDANHDHTAEEEILTSYGNNYFADGECKCTVHGTRKIISHNS